MVMPTCLKNCPAMPPMKLAGAKIATIVKLIDQDYTQPINVGTGIPTDFTTLATTMANAVGYTPTLNPLPDKPTGVHWRVADPTALHQIHTPRIDLAEGIRRAVC